MSSRVFDHMIVAAWEEARPACLLGNELAPFYKFKNVVDLYRFAQALHAAGEGFFAAVQRRFVARLDAQVFRRTRLEGRPLAPHLEELLRRLLELSG